MIQEVSVQENYQRAKKNCHQYSIASQAFTLDGRDFIISNLSLKKDYVDEYDFVNFRRGLSYIQQIVNFNHTERIVARKGLRKFRDLLPEYVEVKQSHVTNSKYHGGEKQRIFKNVQKSTATSFIIYNTEKLNGENAQISFAYDKYWIIGSKNKGLILYDESQIEKIKNKHEHKLTILIARVWFNILKTKTPQEVDAIKLQLSDKTLIGEYCNSQNLQHLVHYGKQAKLFFYALVEKNNLDDDCLATSTTFKFLETYKLPQAKCQIIQAKSYDHTIQKLRQLVVKTNQLALKDGGEGNVVYVSGVDQDGEHNLLICKLKTIQYRIFRKLREKLKIYLQKCNKNFENLMKKYTKEIAELARQFKINRPLEDYIQLGKRAFILCEEQSRPISRFVNNRFIDFLTFLEKKISKQKFMEIVNDKNFEIEQDEIENDNQQEQKQKEQQSEKIIEEKIQIKEQNNQRKIKKILVLVPITIPSTGKTSLLEIVKNTKPTFQIWSISSDECRSNQMADMMKRKKTLSKTEAFQKSREAANKQYYKKMGEIFKNISLSKQENHVFYLDKNHPENALKETIKNINEKSEPFANLKLVKLCLLPETKNRLQDKGQYRYPYSINYILTCLKRVLERPQHLTLEGSELERCKIVFGFTNLFRTFSLSIYNLKKYFDQQISFTFNNQNALDQNKDKELFQVFKEVLLKGKPGDFKTIHPRLELFIELLKKWELKQNSREEAAKDATIKLQNLFSTFDNICFDKQQENVEKGEK